MMNNVIAKPDPRPNSDRQVTIGLIQMAMAASLEENLERGLASLERAVAGGAKIVCFPELFLMRYPGQRQDESVFDAAEPFPGRLTEVMASAAERLGVVLVVPFFEKRASGVYHNSVFVVDADGQILGLYRKMHIPDDPGYQEKYYFTPGDTGFKSWSTAVGEIGVLICWDQWFPEAARLTALEGAEILFFPTAIGWHPFEREARGGVQLASWKTVQQSHAITNGCYVAAVNRTGHEVAEHGGEGIEFWGRSFICNPEGSVVAEAPEADESVLLATLDLGKVAQQRIEWPFFRDRRTDAYSGLTARFGK